VRVGSRAILAKLNVATGGLLGNDEAGLSEVAWTRLDAVEGKPVEFAHPLPLESLGHVRAPDLSCWMDTWFEGRLVRDTLEGTFVSRRMDTDTVRLGTWWAARTK
jgi:hypothetical protein